MPQNLLSRRTLPKPEKDKHLHHTPAWLSSKEAWKHCERRAWECFALGPRTCSPALTGLYVTAKCFPAKYTRALSHSAMVGIGHGAMGATAVFVPLKENSLGGEGGVACRHKEPVSPTLLQVENTTLHILAGLSGPEFH